MRIAFVEDLGGLFRAVVMEVPRDILRLGEDGQYEAPQDDEGRILHRFEHTDLINVRKRQSRASVRFGAVDLKDAKAVQERIAQEGQGAARDVPLRGYQVTVWRREWGDRRYPLGVSPVSLSADQVAADWRALGFTVEVEALPFHHNCPVVTYSLPPEPFEPVLCRVDNCDWIGQHLASHVHKAHAMAFEEYRSIYAYGGPALVGPAFDYLTEMHDKVRRHHDIRAGQFLVEIRGDSDVDVWRFEGMEGEHYNLTWICGTSNYENMEDKTWRAKGDQVLKNMRPVGVWVGRIRDQLGGKT